MTPKMADHFATLRRELQDVQRSLSNLQLRLTTPQLYPAFKPSQSVDQDGRRLRRTPAIDTQHFSDVDSDRCASVERLLLPAAQRLVHGNGSERISAPASLQDVIGPSKELSVRRQNATDEGDSRNDRCSSTTDEDTTAMFTLCL